MTSPSVENPATLRIFRKQAPVQVLGPGKRAVIWVQGCPFACAGCVVPESWDASGGEVVSVEGLYQWILNQPDLEGITLSGGEPMIQAAALVTLIDRLQSQADLGVVCYTGYTWETLQKHGTPEQLALLSRIDLLIDGRFQAEQQGDLLWRGSANQRLLPLSDRYQHDLPQTPQNDKASPCAISDRSAGLEFGLDENGTLFFSGVPPQPNFRQRFEAGLRQRGKTEFGVQMGELMWDGKDPNRQLRKADDLPQSGVRQQRYTRAPIASP